MRCNIPHIQLTGTLALLTLALGWLPASAVAQAPVVAPVQTPAQAPPRALPFQVPSRLPSLEAVNNQIERDFGFAVAPNVAGFLMVTEVAPGSPAAMVGMRRGDNVTAIDAVPVFSMRQLGRALEFRTPDEPIVFGVTRLGRRMVLEYVPPELQLETPDVPEGRVSAQLLGMFLEDAEDGHARVTNVSPRSPAAQAGVQLDDLLVAVNGHNEPTFSRLMDYTRLLVRRMPAGEELALTFERGGEQIEIPIPLPESTLPIFPLRSEPNFQPVNSAVATLEPFGETPVRGKVRFVSTGSRVEILADVYGLDQGWYRMIIRRYGDTSNLQQGSAGPVFNAINVRQALAGEDRLQRLSGDLGMFEAPRPGGFTTIFKEAENLPLSGPQSILGRTVVIHGRDAETGEPGAIVAYGVIGIDREDRSILTATPELPQRR